MSRETEAWLIDLLCAAAALLITAGTFVLCAWANWHR